MKIHRAFLILLAAVSLPVAAQESAPAAWEAVAAAGKVESRVPAAQVWAAVERGDALVSETVVRTGRRGRTTLMHGANVIFVDPLSEVSLPASAGETGQVTQTRGTVLYEVEKREQPHFEVVTPYLVAGVKGTTFMVTVHERYTSVSVEEGLVEVMDPRTGERFDVAAGESMLRMRDEARMEHHDRRQHADKARAGDKPARDKQVRHALRNERRRLDRAVDRRDGLIDRDVPRVADRDVREWDDNAGVNVAGVGDVDDQGEDDDDFADDNLEWASGLGDLESADGIDTVAEGLGDDDAQEEEWEEDLVDDDVRNGTRPDDDFTSANEDDPGGD